MIFWTSLVFLAFVSYHPFSFTFVNFLFIPLVLVFRYMMSFTRKEFVTLRKRVQALKIETDEVYFIKARLGALYEIQTAGGLTKTGETALIVQIENTRFALKRAKNRQFAILNFILNKIESTGVAPMLWEEVCFAHRLGRIDKRFTREIIAQLTGFYLKACIARSDKELRKQQLRAEIRVARQDYTILPIEEDIPQNYDTLPIMAGWHGVSKTPKIKVRVDNSNIDPLAMGRPRHVPEPRFRNIFLLTKVRAIIVALRESRVAGALKTLFGCCTRQQFVDRTVTERLLVTYRNAPYYDTVEIAAPQMDAHGGAEPNVVPAGNVTLTENRVESSVSTTIPNPQWVNFTSSDIVGKYSEMTDRWLKIKDFTWSSHDQMDQQLLMLALPRAVVLNDKWKSCDIPNTIPFRVHRYWRGDMDIKIQINSNKFQIGQLQCAWFYETYLDPTFDLRENVYSGSQTDHVLISAGASNEATLHVPYKSFLPMISTKKRVDISHPLEMGRLFIRVLNPLTVATNAPGEAYGAVFVKFTNCEFTGQIAGTIDEIAQPQMDTMLGLAHKALNVLDCPNMDNPPNTAPGRYMIPTASHSWAVGTGVTEPLQPLRLDSRGQTGHPDNNSNDTSVQSVCRKFGLVAVYKWKRDHHQGSLLFKMDAAPILDKSEYQTVPPSSSETTRYYMPPLAVMASLYNYWRGSIEFRFDIVASQFHTGRLLIGYVPGANASTVVTMDQVLAGPHIVFSLQEGQQFSYEIPYIADRPFWNKRYMGNYSQDAVIAPSMLYCFVLNPLVIMNEIAEYVYINMYMRGGNDFEVAIPVQPCVGTGYNATVYYAKTEVIHALGGYAPYYPGWAKSFFNSTRLLFRYGTNTNQYSLFDNKYQKKSVLGTQWKGFYYRIQDARLAPQYKDRTGAFQIVRFAVGFYIPQTQNKEFVLIPVGTEADARSFTGAYLKSNLSPAGLEAYLISSDYGTTDNKYSDGDPAWIPVAWAYTDVPSVSEDFDIIEVALPHGEREQVQLTLRTGNNLTSTNNGMTFYGENFGDLKDLMRRYQVYTSFPINSTDFKQLGQCAYIVPLVPQGLNLSLGTPTQINEFVNRCRDGHIPIILSGFKYYRGGMRIRIVVPTTKDMIMWVQHRPDRRLRSLIPLRCASVSSAEGVANHTYASYIQDTGVNSMIEIEVPYYMNSAYGLLQRPRISHFTDSFCNSLGELNIGFVLTGQTTSQQFVTTLYHSVADDFMPTTFQGFPPMVLLDDIETVEPQEEATPQMFGFFQRRVEGIKEEIKTEVKETVIETINDASNAAQEKIEKMAEHIKNANFADLLNSSFVRCILTNCAHLCNKCNFKGIAIAICSVLLELGILTVELAKQVTEHLLVLFKSLREYTKLKIPEESGNQSNQPDVFGVVEEPAEVEIAVPHMDILTEGQKASAGIITVLWTALCSLLAIKAKLPSSDWGSFLVKDVKGVMSSANVLFTFIRNILSVLDAMKQKLFGIISPTYSSAMFLDEKYVDIKKWADEVISLDDPSVFDKSKYTVEYKTRVNIAYIEGAIFYKNALVMEERKIKEAIVKLYDKIRSIREKMLELGDDSMLRREPFVIWQCGEPGVGKSTLSTTIGMELLQHRGITTNVPPIYNHEPTSDFWDACVGNPIMVVDDMFAVQQGTVFERQLALLFAVVSPVVLVPPKARLEDKGKPYNPEIVIINSNYKFPRFNNVNEEAIYRRRHVLVEIKLNPDKKIGCEHCANNQTPTAAKAELLVDNHHVLFRVAHNVVDSKTDYTEWMPYGTYLVWLKQKYTIVADKALSMYKMRAESMKKIVNSAIDVNPRVSVTAIRDQQKQFINNIYNESILGQLRQSMYGVQDRFANVYRKIKILVTHEVHPEVPPSTSMSEEQQKIWKEFVDDESILRRPKLKFDTVFPESNGWFPRQQKASPQMDVWKMDNDIFLLAKFFKLASRWKPDEYPKDMYKQYTAVFPKSLAWNLVYGMFAGPVCTIAGHIMFELCGITVSYDRTTPIDSEYDLFSLFFNREFMLAHKVPKEYALVIKPYVEATEVPGHIYFCKHADTSAFNLSIIDGKLMCCSNGSTWDYDIECKDKDGVLPCLWQYHWFKYLALKAYLTLNPLIEAKMVSGDQVIQKELPRVLRAIDVIDLPEKNVFMKALDKARDWIYTYWLKTKPIAAKIMRLIKTSLSVIRTLLMVMAPFLIGIGVACSIYVAGKTSEGEWSNPQSHSYSNVGNNINLAGKVPVATPQSEVPQLDAAIQRIKENTFTIYCQYDDRSLTGHCIVIRDRQLLVLRHYIEEFEKAPPNKRFYGKYSLRPGHLQGSHGVELDFLNLPRTYYNKTAKDGSYGSNYVIIQLPLKIQQCKDLTKFIATQQQHTMVHGQGILLENTGTMHHNINVVSEKGRPIAIVADGVSRIVLQDLYSYKYQARGMCGSILLCPNIERPIIGMHVAGIERGNVRGLAELLVYESFNSIPSFDVPYTASVIPDMTDAEFAKLKFDTHLYPIGCADITAFQSGETQYIPSKIAGVFPIRTEPNPLSQHDQRLPPNSSPLKLGVEHMGKPPRDFKQQDLIDAREHLEAKILQTVKPVRSTVGVLSYELAICGSKDLDGYEPLEWSTSPGYPLRFDKDKSTQSGKKWLFDLEETADGFKLNGFHPKLKKILTVDQALRERGVKPMTIFVDCLKDTCLLTEKCSIPGKTRIFSISPVQYTIQFKQYFNDFLVAYRKARISAECAIGIDVNSAEWTDLASYLQTKGTAIVCGDYKNFGPGLMLEAAKQAFEIMFSWYKFHGDEANNRIRRIMMHEALGAYHLVTNVIYSVPCGIPSGFPATTEINSLVNAIYMRIAWKYTTNLTFSQLDEHVNFVFYGDDVCANVSDSVKEIYNTNTLNTFFEQYNIVFTDISKTGTIIPYRNLLNATFLKNEFKPHPSRTGMWLAALDKISIEGCANWINKKNNPIEATIENAEQAIMLAHGHGKEYYDYVISSIIKQTSTLPTTQIVRYDTWSELDRKRYGELVVAQPSFG